MNNRAYKENFLKNSGKNLIICLILASTIGVTPSCAKLDGGIAKTNFYDTEQTLMPEIIPDTTIRTGKYWDKNLFHINKYRPIFMLSNKELFNFTPKPQEPEIQRVTAPTIYNISLKDTSIKKVSLSQKPAKKEVQKVVKKAASKNSKKESTISTLKQKQDAKGVFLFEQAKNQGVEADEKIRTAILLKETKVGENYSMALDLLDDVIRMEPYNASAYNLKAEIYMAKNDRENAMKNYIDSLNLNPYSKESCLGIAKILEKTDKELAQKYYKRANQ